MQQIDRRIIIAVVSLMVLLIISLLAYFAFRSEPSAPGKNLTEISIYGKDSSKVTVNNFYANPVETSTGMVTINRDTDLATYFYNEIGNKFTITLNEATFEDFTKKKPLAEQEFLKLLGVTEEQACNLNVEVLNGGSFDPKLSGEVFSLSFCK